MSRVASFIDSTIALALVGLVGALSIFYFAQAADSADRMMLAKRIDRHEPVNPKRLAVQAEAAIRLVHSGPLCAAIDRKANIAISFREFAAHNQAEDYDGWLRAADGVDRLLRHAIKCSPHDAEFWTRLALVGRAVVVAPARLDAMLRFSQALSPTDLRMIRMRALLWGVGVGASDAPTRQAALSDLGTMFAKVQPWDAPGMLAPFRPAMQADIDRFAANLAPERLQAFNRHSALPAASPAKAETGKKLLFLDDN